METNIVPNTLFVKLDDAKEECLKLKPNECAGIVFDPNESGYRIRVGAGGLQEAGNGSNQMTYLRPITPTVRVSKLSFMTSEEIEFEFESPYFKKEDAAWIGIVPASIAHGSEWMNDQHVVSYNYLDGAIRANPF